MLAQNPDARGLGDLVTDFDGNLYFSAEHGIFRLSNSGMLVLIAGMPANYRGIVDGDAAHASFDTPADMTRDDAGNLYVLESRPVPAPCCYQRGLVLRKITPGGEVTTLAGPGTWWGKNDTANTFLKFDKPTKIAVDKQGNFYIADYSPSVIGPSFGSIKKISAAGEVSSIADPVSFGYRALQTDSKGNLYFADDSTLYVRSAQGTQIAVYGNISGINAITVAETGDIYLAVSNGVRKIDTHGNLSSLSIDLSAIPNDGQGGALSGIARDKTGTLFISTNRGAVYKVRTDGKLATVAGVFGQQGSRLGASSRLKEPTGLLTLSDGTLAVISGQAILKLVVPK